MGSSEKRAGTSAWMATLTVVCMLRYCIGSLTPNEHSPHRQNTCRMTVQDQFRPIITIHSPVCSVSDIPVAMTDDFPSFEEWKRLRFSQTPNKSTDDNMESSNAGGPEDAHINSHAGSSASPKTLEDIVPTLRVPLTDRFNYASVDCSARIHSSHKESKSPASILSPKRDKYMLSPCATPGKFVIVELCDDIQIDTIQLANSEFFSGVFKDISVSVSVEQKHWKHVGTYSAKNIRTVQSFHPPPDPHFYRYVRIDFLSHYGLEYYCPVSLLHVYGLTQMEEYKWNEWQAAGRKEREAGAEAEYLELAHSQTELIKLTSTAVGATSSVNIGPTESTPAERSTSGQDTVAEASNSAAASATSAVAADIQSTHTHTPIIVPTETLAAPEAEIDDIVNQIMTGGPVYAYAADGKSNASSNIPAESEISSTAPSAPDPAASALQSTATHASPSESSTLAPLNSTAVRYVRSPTDSSTLRSTRPSSYSPSPSLATGESVYRNIMKRLVALESNSSLSVKYIEDQAKSVREALKKLEDDVGKLQTSHQLALRKALLELRNQKRDMEVQRMEFVTQLHTLSNEITLEKRLGVAQLCLLLMVLVFMTFTRGASPGGSLFDELSVPKNSMRTGRRPNLFWRANGLRTNSEPEKPNSSSTLAQQAGTPSIQGRTPASLPNIRAVPAKDVRAPQLPLSRSSATKMVDIQPRAPVLLSPFPEQSRTSRSKSHLRGSPHTPPSYSYPSLAELTPNIITNNAPGSSRKALAKTSHLHETWKRQRVSSFTKSIMLTPSTHLTSSTADENREDVFMSGGGKLRPKGRHRTRVNGSLDISIGGSPRTRAKARELQSVSSSPRFDPHRSSPDSPRGSVLSARSTPPHPKLQTTRGANESTDDTWEDTSSAGENGDDSTVDMTLTKSRHLPSQIIQNSLSDAQSECTMSQPLPVLPKQELAPERVLTNFRKEDPVALYFVTDHTAASLKDSPLAPPLHEGNAQLPANPSTSLSSTERCVLMTPPH